MGGGEQHQQQQQQCQMEGEETFAECGCGGHAYIEEAVVNRVWKSSPEAEVAERYEQWHETIRRKRGARLLQASTPSDRAGAQVAPSMPVTPSGNHKRRKLLVVVDVQNDFILAQGALPVPGATTLISATNEFFSSLNSSDYLGVLFTFDTHLPDVYPQSEEAKQFPPHCYRGTFGWKLSVNPTLISPDIPLWKLEKDVFSMWEDPSFLVAPYSPSPLSCSNIGPAARLSDTVRVHEPTTALEDSAEATGVPTDSFLFELLEKSDLEEVEVIGVASDFCVKAAIFGFVKRGFEVAARCDLTLGIFKQIQEVVRVDLENPPNLRLINPDVHPRRAPSTPSCHPASSSRTACCLHHSPSSPSTALSSSLLAGVTIPTFGS